MTTIKTESKSSEARARLAAAISARTQSRERLDEINEREARLAKVVEAVAPIRAELARLDAEEAAALSAWSAKPGAKPPKPDTAKRENLARKLAEAQASASAATTATNGLTAERNRLAATISATEAPIKLASIEVFIEEIQPDLVAELARAKAKLALAVAEAQAARQQIAAVADSAPTLGDPGRVATLRLLEAFDKAFGVAMANPPEPDVGDWRNAMGHLLMRLRDDASAVIDVE